MYQFVHVASCANRLIKTYSPLFPAITKAAAQKQTDHFMIFLS
jgi:hypothetical protein